MKQHRSIYTLRLIVWYSCFSERDMDIQTIVILVCHAGPMYRKFGPSQEQIGIYRAWIGSNILCDMAPYQFDLQ